MLSTLHRTENGNSDSGPQSAFGPLGTSPTTPWYSPPPHTRPALQPDHRRLSNYGAPRATGDSLPRSRAPSLQSYSSSFVLKPPTSPLVQQSNNEDLDFTPIDLLESPGKSNRRHTLPPQSLGLRPQAHDAGENSAGRQPWSASSFRTHRVRRSLTSNWSFQPASSPQTPNSQRFRKSSITPEASPLQHASMVGSYEESILRGRMSTGPSRPVDFTAQIGALGKGDCKPKHPAHVTIPFPAVYYSWNTGIGRTSSSLEVEPSPYVGHIDIERSLPPTKPKERRKRVDEVASLDGDELPLVDEDSPKKHRDKRRRESSPVPKVPPGGSYRIPQQGHLQILIKNPNKTAVKLFFIPYDLTGMEAGTKTFIRQRCYSAGPIINNPISSKAAAGVADPPTMPLSLVKSGRTLRYLIHINICCPSRGRFYLYQHIRVVFANRVPDNKESLEYEMQLPQPRYSTYKAGRDLAFTTSQIDSRSPLDKTHRRKSYGFGAALKPKSYDESGRLPSQSYAASTTSSFDQDIVPPVPTIPLDVLRSLQRPAPPETRAEYSDSIVMDNSSPRSVSELQSPNSDGTLTLAQRVGNPNGASGTSNEMYNKLSRGDAGYGGLFGRPGTPEPGEGLLARRLKGFDARKDGHAWPNPDT